MPPFWSKERREARAAQREQRRLQRLQDRLSELEEKRDRYWRPFHPGVDPEKLKAELAQLESDEYTGPNDPKKRYLQSMLKPTVSTFSFLSLDMGAAPIENGRFVHVTDLTIMSLDMEIGGLRRALNLPVEEDDEAEPRKRPPDHRDDPPWTGPLKFAWGCTQMNFTRSGLADAGYDGFVAIGDLRTTKCRDVPLGPGTYIVVLPEGFEVRFLDSNPGGRFKGRDPTVTRSFLEARWVPDTDLLYVGSSKGMQKRITDFLLFGVEGRPVAHWGGRLIWQIANSRDLLVAWRQCNDHGIAEKKLLRDFEARYGRLPPANLRH
jgi:hypothetical protein